MIVHTQVCNYCGDQAELPNKCEEDDMFATKKVVNPCKVYGLSLDLAVHPIKSFDGYSRRGNGKFQFTFCTKNCLMEFMKKHLTEQGQLELPK